ncbi:MAG TPA: DUF4190 domain-containing protein [Streptosporangiaceae bacterium]|nr:DUF4190 domain-containing protein [Streptosporangiaceae bacterium]
MSSPEQPQEKGKSPGLPRLHFPQRPDGQGLAPAPGGQPPPPPTPPGQNGPPSPDTRPGPPPGAPPDAPPDAGRPWGNQPPPGWSRPAGQPGPGRPLRPPETATRQQAWAALVLGLMSVIAIPAIGSNFHRGIYLLVFSLVVGITACWFGITAMRRARRALTMRPRGAVAGIVIGVIGALVSVVLLVGFVAFWPQLNDFSRCLQSANTPSAQQTCQDQLNRSVGISGLRPAG